MATMTYEMDELEEHTGLSARTLRFWIQKKLLPKPRGAGRGARYDERHVRRALAAKALRDAGLSLNDIVTKLQGLDDDAIDRIASQRPKAAPDTVPEAPPEPSFPFAVVEVVELMDGLALTIDRSKGKLVRRVAAEIYRHYAHARS